MAVVFNEISSHAKRDDARQQAASIAVEVYEQFGRALVGYLRANLRCDEDAYDLAQEVYLRIARQDDISQIRSLKAFAFTIAKNLLRDKSRRCATKLSATSISLDDVTIAASGCDPLELLEAGEQTRRINSVIAALRPACRQAYLLSRACDLNYATIAECMGISVSMVEKHISTALRALRSGCQMH